MQMDRNGIVYSLRKNSELKSLSIERKKIWILWKVDELRKWAYFD